MRRHRRLQTIARRNGDELPGLQRKQLADRPGVLAADGHAGENQRASIDFVRSQLRPGILLGDKHAKGRGIDAVRIPIGGQKYIGFKYNVALGDDVTAIALFH